MKMDLYCRDIQESLQVEPLPPRHVHLWKEHWETHTSSTNEDVKLKARLEKKYSGLHLYNKDYDSRLLTCAKIHFHKTNGNNRYCIFAVMDGWDPEKDDMDEGNYELWTLWKLDEVLYDCICDYYMANLEEDGVQLHKQDLGVDSDHDGDDK